MSDAGDAFYEQFLGELAGLDHFLARRAQARGAGQAVERTDPDVRRLLEALAYFSARTLSMARRGTFDAVGGLARDLLDALCCPVPAAGLVAFTPRAGFVESTPIPAGTPIGIAGADGTQATFVTACDVTVWPLRVAAARVLRAERGLCLGLELEASAPLNDRLGELEFQLDCLGDLGASLRLRQWLESALVRAGVSFGVGLPQGLEPASGATEPCEVSFGAPSDAVVRALGPLYRARALLHHPEAAQRLRIALPPGPREFRRATLWLELRSAPPQALGPEMFRPFVVPIVNCVQAPAEPIACDGTQERYRLRFGSGAAVAGPGSAELGVYVHAVRGVYELSANGAVPLRTGALGERARTYSLVETGTDPARRGFELGLSLDGTLEHPRRVDVHASWYQPDFDPNGLGAVRARLRTRQIDGVSLDVLGSLRRHRVSTLGSDPFALLEVLALRAKDRLDRDEIHALLGVLGADEGSPLGAARELIQRVRVEDELVIASGTSSVRRVYSVWTRDHDASLQPFLLELLARLEAVLDAWGRHAVEVRLDPAEPARARRSA